MREFNALEGYPQPKEPRVVSPNIRTVHHRVVACQRGKDYFDGDRNYGYGGYKYDDRWDPIVKNIYKEYGLKENSSILQLGSEKGFLLYSFQKQFPNLKLQGVETSDYAIQNTLPSIKDFVAYAPYTKLPFADHQFDFVYAAALVYTLNLPDAIQCLREIERVGKGKSFITLGSYRTEEEYRLFKYWTLLGTLILHEDEWIEVLKYAGYTGDYFFMNSRALKLVEKSA